MSFHNVRDKYGRFAPKKRTNKPKEPQKELISVFILDRSGSMSGKEKAVQNAYNELLLAGQKDAKKTKVVLTEALSLFSDGNSGYNYAKNFTWKIGSVQPFTERNPFVNDGGMTALNDAVGNAIEKVEAILAASKNAENTRVLITVFTDGYENDSKRYSNNQLKSLVERKQKEGWTITYIGPGSDKEAATAASKIGIFASNASGYANNARGSGQVVNKLMKSRSAYVAKVAADTDSNIGFFGN